MSKGNLDKFAVERAAARTTLDYMKTLYSSATDAGQRTTLVDTAKMVLSNHNDLTRQLIVDTFKDQGYFPANLENTALHIDTYYGLRSNLAELPMNMGAYGKFNATPRSKVSDLIEISKVANMIVIPFEYLNPESYKGEPWQTPEEIKGFKKACDDTGMQMFVICPLRHYSILQHLRAPDANLPIVANAYQQNFDVLGMMMPAMMMFSDKLSTIECNLETLYKKIDTLDSSMKSIVRGMESMETKLNQLQAKVEEQQLEVIRQKFAAAELEQAQARIEASARRSSEYSWFMAYEPLAFALPKGVSPLSDEEAFVGPCWGPDFDQIVAAALEFKAKKGQRQALMTATGIWR